MWGDAGRERDKDFYALGCLPADLVGAMSLYQGPPPLLGTPC